VISGPVTAESLHGHIVIANESLADVAEGERVFILAHELGHVVSGHWLQMGLLYQRWIPGEVIPENTNPIAGSLGREASALAHRQEFEADAFALQALKALGRTPEDAFSTFLHQGVSNDTATHPGTRKRVASLRQSLASDNDSAHAGLASETLRP
jgi:Zn-dependent protease with chaperone function